MQCLMINILNITSDLGHWREIYVDFIQRAMGSYWSFSNKREQWPDLNSKKITLAAIWKVYSQEEELEVGASAKEDYL